MDWVVGILTGVISAVIGGAATGVPLYLRLRKGMSEIRQEERDVILSEYNNLIIKLRETLTEVGIELRGARSELAQARLDRETTLEEKHECLQHQERMDERMGYLEDALRNAKIPFREWKEDNRTHPLSGVHPRNPVKSPPQLPHPPEGSGI